MDFTRYAALVAAWVSAHPIEAGIIFLAFMNVLMAQIPKPKSAVGLAIYNSLSRVLLIVSTHKDEPGTFTWPWLLKIFMEQGEKTPPVSIASPAPEPPDPLVDPKSPPPPHKDDGEDHGS